MAETPIDGPAENAVGPPLRLRYSAVSDVGRHRKENQDSGYASEHLLAVADGVGGAAYGDVASSTAVHLLRRLDKPPTEELLPALAGVVHRIHDKLAEMVEDDAELDGTSTTVTAALFDGHRLGFVHIGDSRAYLFRDGTVRQITKDHTFVQTLVDEGRITEEDSRVHPHRNIILRAVDSVHETEPDLFHVELRSGDRVLLCSDGCSGAVTDRQLASLLAGGSIDAVALDLVQAALDNGTTDNVTVVVAEAVPVGTVDDSDTSAAMTTGPMLVGAAADQPRRGGMLSRALFRNRQQDTGELDPVTGGSADQPVDPEELRYAPRPPRRRAGLRRLLLGLLALLVLVGVTGAAYAWSQQQYYVAADGPQVAIFKGVQVDLPGVELSRPYEVDDLRVEDLPAFRQEEMADGKVADDLEDARRIVSELTEEAEAEADARAGGESAAECPDPTPSRTPDRSDRSPRGSEDGPARTRGATPTPTGTPDSAADPCAEGAS
jgi:serine/threonine protein phosphatase PrpC